MTTTQTDGKQHCERESNTTNRRRTTPRKGEQHHERKENNIAKERATPQNEKTLTNGGKILKFEALTLLLLLMIRMTMIRVQVFKATVVQMMVGRFGEFPPPPCGNALLLAFRMNVLTPSSR
jgi:hypothetical protein